MPAFPLSYRRALLLTAFAICAALLFIGRDVLLWASAMRDGQTYTYFSFLHPDAIANLGPLIRDGMDGHWFPADGRVNEHTSNPNLWGPAMTIMHAPFFLFTRDIPTVMVVSRGLAIFLSFFILYAILARLFGGRRPAVFASFVFLLAPLVWSRIPPFSRDDVGVIVRSLVPYTSLSGEVLLSKYTSLSIYPTLPLLLLGLWALLCLLEERKRWQAILLGAVVGLLATLYITHAIYLVGIVGISFAIVLYRRVPGILPVMVWTAASAAVTSAPFLWNYLHIHSSPFIGELYLRLGGDMTHAFRWNEWFMYVVYILCAWGVYRLAARRGRPERGAFLAAGVCAAIWVLNMQVLTGYNPAPTVWKHHQIFFGFFLAGIYTLWSGYVWCRTRGGWARAVAAAVLVLAGGLVMGRAVAADVYAVSYTRPTTALPGAYVAAFQWMNEHTDLDSVVVSPSLASNSILPTFTHHRVLMGKAITSAAGEWELLDRVFVSYVLFDVPSEHLEAALRKQVAITDPFFHTVENDLVSYLYEYRFISTELNSFYRGASRAVPEAVVQEIVEQYRKYPRRLGYLLNHYQMDYLFVGPMERQIMRADFSTLPYLNMVYDHDGIQIYAIDRSKI